MGTWGPGNFDDDVARDYLADVIARFERFIERILTGDIPEEAMGMANMLDAGEHCLLPTVEIISAFHEALGSDYLPSPQTVARWSETYPLQVEPLLKTLDPLWYEGWYVRERRPVVQATFARLLRQSQALYQNPRADDEASAAADRPRELRDEVDDG
jgi:hypothetical protein